jgi:hypothetical protein
MHDILDIIRNIDDLYENNSSLAILKDFERVIDELDVYVYENWEDGELAFGPQVDRHWITAGFMWPQDKMPNPMGAKRLQDIGCRIKYEKSHLVEPRSIKTPDDIRPGTKKGKLDRKPIWIVEIQMPKKVAFDMYKGYMDRMKAEQQETENSQGPAAPPPAPMGAMPGAIPAGVPAAGGAVAPGGAPAAMPAGGAPAPTV